MRSRPPRAAAHDEPTTAPRGKQLGRWPLGGAPRILAVSGIAPRFAPRWHARARPLPRSFASARLWRPQLSKEQTVFVVNVFASIASLLCFSVAVIFGHVGIS